MKSVVFAFVSTGLLSLAACQTHTVTDGAPAMAQATQPGSQRDERLTRIVEANIQAVHAYQLLMVNTPGEDGPRPKSDPAAWSAGGVSDRFGRAHV